MTPPRLSLAAMLIATFTLIAPPVFADDCTRLCDYDFMREATAQDIQAEINKGADIETRDILGRTPLHIAAILGKAEAVTALLEAGADIKARTEDGATPLHYAVNAEAVTALLQAGADIKARTEGGKTPLYVAALSGRAEAVIALIKAGADGKAKGTNGKIPFDYAKDNADLKNTKAYWLLNEAQY